MEGFGTLGREALECSRQSLMAHSGRGRKDKNIEGNVGSTGLAREGQDGIKLPHGTGLGHPGYIFPRGKQGPGSRGSGWDKASIRNWTGAIWGVFSHVYSRVRISAQLNLKVMD